MWQFALKNILTRKLRSALAIVGLSISIIGAVCLLSVSSGIKQSIQQTFSLMDGLMVMQKNCLTPSFSTVDETALESIRKIRGVKYVLGELYRLVPSVENKSTLERGMATALFILGVDSQENSQHPSLYRRFLKEGRPLELGDNFQVILSRRVAERYKKKLGDDIKIIDAMYKIVGICETESFILDATLIIPLATARSQLKTDSSALSYFYVVTDDINGMPGMKKEIEKLFPSLDAKNPMEWANEIISLARQMDIFILMIAFIAIIVSTIGILNTMLMSITERFVEFGILKANGWTNGDVVKLVMVETGCLGLISGFIGCLVSYVIVKILGMALYVEPIIPIWLLISAFLSGLILALVGGVYPAYRAVRLNPIDAIRLK